MGLLDNNRCPAHVLSTLNTMRKNGEFCDLVFELSNCKFSAHRLVMAAWSLPVKNLLQLQSACTQHLHVVYDQPDVFHMFINFMYTGDLPVQVTDISSLLLLGATFQIPLLMELCEEQLENNRNVENVVEMCCLSIKFQLLDLEQHCIEFLCKHLKEITQRQAFLDLTPAQMDAVLGSHHLLNYSAGIGLSLISLWLAKDIANREQFLVLLLKHIEWSKMPDNYLKEIIHTDSVFTSNPSSLYLLLQTVYFSDFPLGLYMSSFQSLQKQYGCRLNSICNSSDLLNSFQPKHFQPLQFSLVFPTNGDLDVPESASNFTQIIGIKNELVQFVNSGKKDMLICNNSASFDNDQQCVNTTQDVPVLADKTSLCTGFSKTSSVTSCNSLILEGAQVADIQSADVKVVRIRRQLVKPHRFIRDSDMTKIIASKTAVNKTKKNVRGQQRSRGKFKDRNTMQKRMTTRQVSINTAETAKAKNVKPGYGNMLGKISPVTGRRTKNSTKLLQSCSQCDYTTYNQLSLQKHQKQVHEGNCLFCCSLCSFKSKWSKAYYDHMKQSHFPGPPFLCDDEQCEYSTDTFQQLASHRRQHSDQRPFVCDICLVAFRSKNNLYQHFKIHSDEKKFECSECRRSFKLKNSLEQHMVIHSNLRPYLCDLCGFCTKFQSHLISHKRIHTGDVYRCDFQSCSYFTPRKSQLKSHMRSHLGVRCHICGSCGKAFIEKSHLIRHERVHSSERSHVCKQCTYSSTRADKLREHVHKHHSDETLGVKTIPSVSKKLGASRKVKVKVTSEGDKKCQLQPTMVESTEDSASVSSIEKQAIITCHHLEGSKIAATDESISCKENENVDATVLSFTTTINTSPDFSKAYTECGQTSSQHGLQMLLGVQGFTTPTLASSAEMQPFFHLQQNEAQQHKDLQAQANIEQSDFLSNENYLY